MGLGHYQCAWAYHSSPTVRTLVSFVQRLPHERLQGSLGRIDKNSIRDWDTFIE